MVFGWKETQDLDKNPQLAKSYSPSELKSSYNLFEDFVTFNKDPKDDRSD